MECVAYYILLLRVHEKGVSHLYPYVEIKMPSIKKIKKWKSPKKYFLSIVTKLTQVEQKISFLWRRIGTIVFLPFGAAKTKKSNSSEKKQIYRGMNSEMKKDWSNESEREQCSMHFW